MNHNTEDHYSESKDAFVHEHRDVKSYLEATTATVRSVSDANAKTTLQET